MEAKSVSIFLRNYTERPLGNTQQRTQPPLALSVPLSRFTSRVGGGSALVVRRSNRMFMKRFITIALVSLTASIALARFVSGYYPPRSLPEAYQIAVQTLGLRTNALVCIEGKRIKYGNGGYWDFVFEGTDTNRVVVTDTDIDPSGCIDCLHQ